MSRDECPSGVVLGRYALGELSDAEAESLSAHLGACASCLAHLDDLVASTDPLVAALRRPASFGHQSNPQLQRAVAHALAAPFPLPGPGAELGGYRLLEVIGHGGMGRVYRARHPRLDQEVALKVLRPGLDSAPILARFEAERQALAVMDHPGIARVFDGGVTEDGQPFFVMELVQGVTLSRYCGEHGLDVRRRLELFGDICQAVQHAHQKGVIHRDLKPSNVLVTEYDGRPVPKVIDFGVAKALERSGAAQTEVGMLIGTPQYMSPEQADLTSNDIDTRSDIYSLGVLLYELLTGDTPIPHAQLSKLPVLEVLRLVREVEPPCPSSRLSAADTHREVRGELDWIAMKCLENDRNRRYESAAALAEDVRRHLQDEPVAAGPPSQAYRLRKFVRRNRAAVLAVSLILVSLLGGTAGTTVGMIRAWTAEGLATERLHIANEETSKAREERDAADRVAQWVAKDLLGQASSYLQQSYYQEVDPDIKLRTALDRAVKLNQDHFAAHPRVEVKLRYLIGQTYNALGDGATARSHLERGWELVRQLYDPDTQESLQMMSELAKAHSNQKEYHRAEPLVSELAQRVERSRRPSDRMALEVRMRRAELLTSQERFVSAEAALTPLLEDCRRELGSEDSLTLGVESMLGFLLNQRQEFARAAPLLEHAFQGKLRSAGPDHPTTWLNLLRLAENHQGRKQLDVAETLFLKVLAQQRRLLGPAHPTIFQTLAGLGGLYVERRDFTQAKPLLTEVLEGRRRLSGNPVAIIGALVHLANLHVYEKQYTQAEPLLVEAIDLARKHRADSRTRLRAVNSLGALHLLHRRYDRAEPHCREVLEIVRRHEAPAPNDLLAAYTNLTYCLLRQAKHAAAEPFLREYLALAARHQQGAFVVGFTRAQLGNVLTQKKQYADAEASLVTGYQEMLRGRAAVPATAATARMNEAVRWLVQMYEAWDRPDEAAKWRAKLPPAKQPRKSS